MDRNNFDAFTRRLYSQPIISRCWRRIKPLNNNNRQSSVLMKATLV